MLSKALQSAASSANDPNFKNVTLLLHGDGTNGAQNNTFVDSSANNFTITRNGNATQGSFSPYGDLWSNYFDGSGDFLRIADNAAFELGSNNFTVEGWFYLTAYSPNYSNTYVAALLGKDSSTSRGFEFNVRGTASSWTGLYCWLFSNNTTPNEISATAAIQLQTWYHFAFVRNGTSVRIYLNGVDIGGGTTSAVVQDTTTDVTVGSLLYTSYEYYFPGYISNLRLVKGTAVYNSNFTPSTTPLTAVSGTSLLTCQSNRLRDASSNNFAITRNGDVSVQRFSPFSPASEYSTATNGGSGYFDGTGDYLKTPTTGQFAPTGDFTVSAWFYPTALSTANCVVGNYTSGVSTDWEIMVGATGIAYFYNNSNAASITSAVGAVRVGQWNYIALVRSGSTITLYVNGTSAGTTTYSGTLGSATKTVGIGANGSNAQVCTGYISSVRLLSGTADTATPTAPPSAAAGTNLLLNFINGAIFDNAGMNDLETVGDAKISTSVKKFGTGSIAFDGTGDWLLTPHTEAQVLGLGAFTIELWVYLTATGSAIAFVSKGTSTTGWAVNSNGTQWGFAFDSSSILSTGTVTANSWTHIAVVREGTGTNQTKIYVNGVNDGTGTVSSNFNQTNPMYVGSNRIGSVSFSGYIDDLRITKGVARYTANFTPPSAPFQNK